MKGRVNLSISCIHNNWIAVQKEKLAKLSRHSSNVSGNLSVANKTQEEEGCFHVFVKGFNSYTLFYDNEDRVYFLLFLGEASKKTGAKISAFILMDNHFHLQVITSQLSNLMRLTLYKYSGWFRRKYGIEGPVFKRPFGRSKIFSYLLAKENMLYILSNASRDYMCATHRDYIWSSYNSHPEVIRHRKNGMLPLLGESKSSRKLKNKNRGESHLNSLLGKDECLESSCTMDSHLYTLDSDLRKRIPLPIPKRGRGRLPSPDMILQNDITQVLKVDISFMVSSFKDLEELDCSIHSYEPLKKKLLNGDTRNIGKSNKCYRISLDAEVSVFFLGLLNGRKFSSITSLEREQMIRKLKKSKGATHRQVSSIMRIKN